MAYQASIEYLYGLQRFGIKLGLGNIRALLSRLGDPHRDLRAIHVAGSDGKGSVCAILEAILRRAGYRVGLYTSPHLVRFNERIRVDGEEISDEDVVRLTEEIRPHAEALAARSKAMQPTFFEFTTAMALLYFLEKRVDVAIVEVGMGGRLDATNVVSPDVAVITRIGMEHSEYLGRTLDRIAREKAGIVKEGVPLWTVDQPSLPVIQERCVELGAPLRVIGRDLSVERSPEGFDGQAIVITNGGRREYKLSLLGNFQAENAALAVGVTSELKAAGWRIPEVAVRKGLSEVQWPARLEVIARYPAVILDATHTREGARRLRESLIELLGSRPVRAVIGVLSDKDIAGIAEELTPVLSSAIATQPRTERGLDAEVVAEAFKQVGQVKVIRSVKDAVHAALSNAAPHEAIIVTGSLYTAGEAEPHLREYQRKRSLEILRRLKERYLPGDFATADLETALGKITRETEDPFVVLISTVLSQRTADPTTQEVASNLFQRFPSPEAMASASLEELEKLVRPANFYRTKARAIRDIARRIVNDFGGHVPRDIEELCSLPLVGRKTANCVLVYGYGIPSIPVDVHCHRVPNRIGLIHTRKEAETEAELKRIIPRHLWVEVNEIFVRHGQTVCTPREPNCASCNLSDLCEYSLSRLTQTSSET